MNIIPRDVLFLVLGLLLAIPGSIFSNYLYDKLKARLTNRAIYVGEKALEEIKAEYLEFRYYRSNLPLLYLASLRSLIQTAGAILLVLLAYVGLDTLAQITGHSNPPRLFLIVLIAYLAKQSFLDSIASSYQMISRVIDDDLYVGKLCERVSELTGHEVESVEALEAVLLEEEEYGGSVGQ